MGQIFASLTQLLSLSSCSSSKTGCHRCSAQTNTREKNENNKYSQVGRRREAGKGLVLSFVTAVLCSWFIPFSFACLFLCCCFLVCLFLVFVFAFLCNCVSWVHDAKSFLTAHGFPLPSSSSSSSFSFSCSASASSSFSSSLSDMVQIDFTKTTTDRTALSSSLSSLSGKGTLSSSSSTLTITDTAADFASHPTLSSLLAVLDRAHTQTHSSLDCSSSSSSVLSSFYSSSSGRRWWSCRLMIPTADCFFRCSTRPSMMLADFPLLLLVFVLTTRRGKGQPKKERRRQNTKRKGMHSIFASCGMWMNSKPPMRRWSIIIKLRKYDKRTEETNTIIMIAIHLASLAQAVESVRLPSRSLRSSQWRQMVISCAVIHLTSSKQTREKWEAKIISKLHSRDSRSCQIESKPKSHLLQVPMERKKNEERIRHKSFIPRTLAH